MATAVASLAASCAGPRPAGGTHTICTHLALEPRASGSQRISGNILVHVYRLSMLPQVIESGEPPRTVALEGALAGVFSDVTGEMFAASKTQVAGRKVRAEETLAFFLFRRRRAPKLGRLMVGRVSFSIGISVYGFVGYRHPP